MIDCDLFRWQKKPPKKRLFLFIVGIFIISFYSINAQAAQDVKVGGGTVTGPTGSTDNIISTDGSIFIGAQPLDPTTLGSNSVVITNLNGTDVPGAFGQNSVTVGNGSGAYASGGIALGSQAQVQNVGEGNDSIAIGTGATASRTWNIAIGPQSSAGLEEGNTQTLAVGAVATATHNNSIAFGTQAAATADQAVAIGASSNANATSAIVIGDHTQGLFNAGSYSIALGRGSQGIGDSSAAIGDGAVSYGVGAVALGQGATTGNIGDPTIQRGTALGAGAQALGPSTLAAGYQAQASETQAVAIGPNANATAINSVALGYGSQASIPNTISVGSGNGTDAYTTRRITNVTRPVNPNDAATKAYVDEQVSASVTNDRQYLDSKIKKFSQRIDNVGAIQASLITATTQMQALPEGKKTAIGVGVGAYGASKAGTVGIIHRLPGNFQLMANGSIATGGEKAGGIGFGYVF